MKRELELLREAMRERGIDVYLLTMDDDHQSEYVGPYYKELRFISGFTGSAGKLVVTHDDAGLWTDGRYFVQAERELSGSGIRLMPMGQPGTPDIVSYIVDALPKEGRLGMNGRTVSLSEVRKLREAIAEKHGQLFMDMDLPGTFWTDRPARQLNSCFMLSEGCYGSTAGEKLERLRLRMRELNAESHVIASLDDIAWLLNLRGSDIPYNPVFMSFMLIERDRVRLYMDERHLTGEIRAYLSRLGIELITDEEQLYRDLGALSCRTMLLDPARVNGAIGEALPEDMRLIEQRNPSTLMKNLKDAAEMKALKRAHVKDGLALTRFMRYFKEQVSRGRLTECSLVDKIHELRAMGDGFLGESFETISAYGENAAMCHYSPAPDHDRVVEPRGLYLLDSGGQYMEGTTDVTRTFVCGPLTDEERVSFTLTVVACLRLSAARFPEGTGGAVLDYAAREVFWKRGLDYDHGTGHGVGFLLNVHEGPAAFRYKSAVGDGRDTGLYEGAFVSDEPGYYKEGSHGVRTENLLMCVKDRATEHGQFCRFDIYTLCPIDRDGLDLELMEPGDRELLDTYHRQVLESLSPYMEGEELEWLRKACAPVV